MNMVLTLIVNPENTDVTEETVKNIAATLVNAEVKTLADGEAWDIFFDAKTAETFAALDGIKADWHVQPTEGRKKKLLLADMDSTIITVECIDELADFAGLKDKVSEITEAAMRGELDFAGALTERVALLDGMDAEKLEECYQERVTLMPGAAELIGTMEANGAYTALVSGGFTFFTGRVAETIGFSLNRANVLEIVDGKLTGKVVPPICDANTKLATLTELRGDKGLSEMDVIAVGDGANDIPMIDAAGLGVAYHAKPKAQDAADVTINHGNLTALLYLQGYKKSEFEVK